MSAKDDLLVLGCGRRDRRKANDPIPLPDLRGEEHAEFAAAFWSLAAEGGPDACRLWTGRRHDGRFDYGLYEFAGRRNVFAHRLAYALTKGPVPAGAQVNHKCDNPPCVQFSHLHLGTQRTNMREMALRDRAPLMRHPAAEVDDMRRRAAAGETVPAIAARYDASPGTARNLVFGHSPRHLPPTVRPPVPVRSSIADRINLEVADLLVRNGSTISAVAALYGVRADSLGYTLRRAKTSRLDRRSSIRPMPAMSAHVAALVGGPILAAPPISISALGLAPAAEPGSGIFWALVGLLRRPKARLRGEQNGNAKLTEAGVREIRRLHAEGGVTQSAIAIRFGISRKTGQDVLSGRTWAHVEAV